ncbi:hypothetical protein [Saccharibacillus sacchari]|uniref:Uncharacterized protein n=1 Tax=Saccharibacillus sacchari TaxID=456493 RepID=A0ACC6PCH2_9BACL
MNRLACLRSSILLIALSFAFSILLTACDDTTPSPSKNETSISSTAPDQQQDPETKMREIAWNSLNTRQQGDVQGNWQEAKVKRVEGSSIWYGIAMDNQNAEMPDDIVLVTFNTLQDSMLGPLVIYIDAETEQRIGVGVRE